MLQLISLELQPLTTMLFGDEMPQRSSEWPLKVSAMTVAGPALRLITLSLKKPLVAVSILILDGAI